MNASKFICAFLCTFFFHDCFYWNLCGMTFVKTFCLFFYWVKKQSIDVGNHKHCFKYILIRNINKQLSCTLLSSHVRLKLWGGKRKNQCLPWQQEELPNMTVPKPYQWVRAEGAFPQSLLFCFIWLIVVKINHVISSINFLIAFFFGSPFYFITTQEKTSRVQRQVCQTEMGYTW